jgi:hypothetical protein
MPLVVFKSDLEAARDNIFIIFEAAGCKAGFLKVFYQA